VIFLILGKRFDLAIDGLVWGRGNGKSAFGPFGAKVAGESHVFLLPVRLYPFFAAVIDVVTKTLAL
jgi:hypothetical protein